MAGRETAENDVVSTSTGSDETGSADQQVTAVAVGEGHATVPEETEPPDSAMATPEGALLFVPPLLSSIETSETAESSGRALCLLVGQYPDTAADVVEGLVERLVADPKEGPVLRTLATLVADHDDLIRGELVGATDRETARTLYEHIQQTSCWNLAEQTTRGDELPRGIRQVVELADEPTEDESRTEHVQRDTGEQPDERVGDAGAGASRTESQPRTAQRRQRRIRQIADSETFTRIQSRSRFEELDVVAPKSQRRYGDVIRTRAVTDNDEYGVAIRLCPETDSEAFGPAVTEAFDSWEVVHSRSVVSAVDWGREPRPWIATEYVEKTLADRGKLDPTTALAHAHTLTAGLAELHQQDVVHGGIDPQNVVYATDVLDDEKSPMLDNVGLMTVFRQCFDPSSYLDPRYAAPEYFDSQFGSLDHATDIYQLGMVLYSVATGRPPFDGTFETVARNVQKDHPPAPSTIETAFPEAFDEIIAKATAKQKLTRYETANQFHRDVDRLCKRVLE